MSTFTHGYANPKFKNKTSAGGSASNNSVSPHTDIDFPLFRLGDVYLMYAEAQLRLGNSAVAIEYVNLIRTRGFGNSSFNVSTLTLDDILDERAREMQWEATRRTDLIRFGYFTSGDYVWPFKGGVKAGTSVPSFRNLYPIPSADLTANSNLVQNPGY